MLRFTIRDVLWLMVVAALAIGWWWDSFSLEQDRREFTDAQLKFAEEHELNYDIRGGRVIIREK
jgi:hypothetical protein